MRRYLIVGVPAFGFAAVVSLDACTEQQVEGSV
jgi:hypothetical protein